MERYTERIGITVNVKDVDIGFNAELKINDWKIMWWNLFVVCEVFGLILLIAQICKAVKIFWSGGKDDNSKT